MAAKGSDDFRVTMYTVDARGNRKWVYPTIVQGVLRQRRRVVAAILVVLYVILPWITVGTEQAVKLDLLHRRFTFFGQVFFAADTLYFFLLVSIAIFSLFFFTAALGRIWCGWACPETVFLEFIFRPIEQLIEGNVADRRRLDAAPWSTNKILRKGTKYLLFAGIAWILANTLLAYFVGREELLAMMRGSPADHPKLFGATLFMMGLLLFQFGWFREQFCSLVCPYARFQSVLMDRDSVTVAYDFNRGEQRGKPGKVSGDCIDCGLCVRVCPAGIDIRNGLQLECVQCSACIDACNQIMTKIGRAPGLIRYTTERALEEKQYRFLRPRIILYGAILLAFTSGFASLVTNRPAGEYTIVRATRDTPFVVDTTGEITNHFKLHLVNHGEGEARYTIQLLPSDETDTAVQLLVPGTPYSMLPDTESELPIFIRFPKSLLKQGHANVRIEVRKNDLPIGTRVVPLIWPEI